MARIGFRVYTDKAPIGKPIKNDEIGQYIGWSERFDEDIPLFHPRIQRYQTREDKNAAEEHDLEDD